MSWIKYLLILFMSFLIGCTNYESEDYISYENEVIKEIIPKLFSIEYLEIRDIENVSIYLIDELHNEIKADIQYDEIWESSPDGLPPEKLISREVSSKSLIERELFEPFLNDRLESRNLNIEIQYENLNLKQISFDDFKNRKRTTATEGNYNPSITEVYLFLTRIAFNKSKDLGYLNYGVFCGDGCAWSNNIEIKKVDGKWIVSRLFSGGIA